MAPSLSLHQQGSQPPMSGVTPYGRPITLHRAKAIAAQCSAHALANGWAVAIAVVDPGGHLIYFEREDGTQFGSLQMAIGKAVCSAGFKRTTKEFEDRVTAGTLRVLAMDGVVPVEGGIPLEENGEIIGAIGVSGGSSAQDGQVATVGAQALATV